LTKADENVEYKHEVRVSDFERDILTLLREYPRHGLYGSIVIKFQAGVCVHLESGMTHEVRKYR